MLQITCLSVSLIPHLLKQSKHSDNGRIQTNTMKTNYHKEKTMNNNMTRVIAIIDQQQSTTDNQLASVTGYNDFLTSLRTVTEPCEVTLVVLDGQTSKTKYTLDLKQVPAQLVTDFSSRTKTGLIDAIGYAMKEAAESLDRMPEQERPGRIIFLIMTDGSDTGSTQYTLHQVAETIGINNKYGWEFMYLGGNKQCQQFSRALNVPYESTLEYVASPQPIRNSFKAAALLINSYRVGEPDNARPRFTEEDRQLAKGIVAQMATPQTEPQNEPQSVA